VAFNGASAAFTVVNDGVINTTVPVGATTGSLSVTNTCATVNAPSVFTVPSTATLNVRLLIEGFYDATTNQMIAAAAPGVSDTVTVELHNTTTPFSSVYSVNVALNLLGQGSITLPAGYLGNSYYLVFRHRNALETWSKNPVTISSVTNFDLTQ
jgi:hypothetical protein